AGSAARVFPAAGRPAYCAGQCISSNLRPTMAFPYRADHVGSLLPPRALLDARNDALTREQLKTIEDTQILDVLTRQKEDGLKILTDGELRSSRIVGYF